MLSPTQKKDKVIRSTDIDALSCRFSCNEKGYLDPADLNINKIVNSYSKYLQYCEGYTNLSAGRTFRQSFNEKKFPLINRGTYIRTQLITVVIEEFIKKFESCQIVSLGGGSDTRAFSVLNHSNVKYVEIDFPETAKVKKLAIIDDEELRQIVQAPETQPASISSKDQFQAFSSDLHTPKYHLIGFDLRRLTDLKQEITQYIDPKLPTLVLSECVLCYSTPEENEAIIKFWANYFNETLMAIIIYEPISLNDSFGRRMAENLQSRGINLLTLNEFPTLESKVQFLKKNGLKNIRATDIAEIGGYGTTGSWFTEQESIRINKLELIDEIEEIQLLLLHYCLIYGENSCQGTFESIDKWKWKLTA